MPLLWSSDTQNHKTTQCPDYRKSQHSEYTQQVSINNYKYVQRSKAIGLEWPLDEFSLDVC